MSWFAHMVAHHPYVVLVAVGVFSGTCLVIPLTTIKLPNFKDPQMGFEARGTVIAQRLTAWENLIEATRQSGPLTPNPNAALPSPTLPPRKDHMDAKSAVLAIKTSDRVVPSNANELTGWREEHADSGFNVSLVFEDHRNGSYSSLVDEEDSWTELTEDFPHHDHAHDHLSTDGYFCGSPSPDYSRVVVAGTNLFSHDSMLAMCRLESLLMTGQQFTDLCQTISGMKCCRAWSLPNYVAMVHNRSSCFNITKEDVNATLRLIESCSHFYFDLQLTPDYDIKDVPLHCRQHNAVYNMIHFLINTNFLPRQNGTKFLQEAMLFLPIAQSIATLDYYNNLDIAQLSLQDIKVVAIEFGLKSTLFDQCLLRDTWLIGLGAVFVLLCMWLYTGSLFITLMTIVAIAFSLGISYFIYALVFELHFFPFMNILASIVAVGIGADDAFILCKVWQCAKADGCNTTLAKVVQSSLRHSALSMCVTSLTTAAAFYSSFVSAVTAICCFSVFAGTAVLVNFALMVTWLPAAVVVSEQICWPSATPSLPSLLPPLSAALRSISTAAHALLLTSVLRLRYLWVMFLGGIALASVAVVFYYPRLRLPDSPELQLFQSNHPFEQYDLMYRDMFWFERLQKSDSWVNPDTKLPLRFVWGVLPLDTGDFLDPASRGKLQLDPTFDPAAPDSQLWLMGFCKKLRGQPFYQSTSGLLLANCFIESFVNWMDRRCVDSVDRVSREPCCEKARFPYSRRVFNLCLMRAVQSLYNTPAELFLPGVAGPKFSRPSSQPAASARVKALVVEYDSSLAYSTSYLQLDTFYRQVETWSRDELSRAPPGMRNGWFVSQLALYDLQRALSRDTVTAIAVSMTLALLVVGLATLNILVSLYAIATITCAIFVTIAVLVLAGWRLNVLEAVSVSVSIGLAVDFSLHYAVNYRMCPESESRAACVAYSLSMMGGPTAMAALTTAAAGAFMLPSTVLAYIQIGIFLIVVMCISWLYSTYFLMSLLAIAGPESGFGQFSYPRLWKRSASSDKTIYTNVLSESTLSTSSTAVCTIHGNQWSNIQRWITPRSIIHRTALKFTVDKHYIFPVQWSMKRHNWYRCITTWGLDYIKGALHLDPLYLGNLLSTGNKKNVLRTDCERQMMLPCYGTTLYPHLVLAIYSFRSLRLRIARRLLVLIEWMEMALIKKDRSTRDVFIVVLELADVVLVEINTPSEAAISVGGYQTID